MPWNIPRRVKASYQMFSIYGITAKILCHILFAQKQNLQIMKIKGMSTETAKKKK